MASQLKKAIVIGTSVLLAALLSMVIILAIALGRTTQNELAATIATSSGIPSPVAVSPSSKPDMSTPLREPTPAARASKIPRPPDAMPEPLPVVTESPMLKTPTPEQPVPYVPPEETLASAESSCPTGVVSTGLTEVNVNDELPWIVGTIMNISGRGEFFNGTTGPVKVTSVPNIHGLDSAGDATAYPDSLDFDYLPPPGTPRPSAVEIAPGATLTYSFTIKDFSSESMSRVVAWYSEPWQESVQAIDIDTYIQCGHPPVVPNRIGPSILNTHSAR